MAGDKGFEPLNDGVRVRCLTAWLIPKLLVYYTIRNCKYQSSIEIITQK
jgi:hypothetical protein